MSSNALLSQGSILSIGDSASPEVFTEIQETSNIDGPGGQAAEIDVTDLGSTGKEYKLGLQEEGDISFDIFYIPANTQHALLRTLRASGANRNFRITFTDSPATTWTFSALVKGFTVSMGVDNVLRASVTLKVSGSITEA